MSEVKKNTLVHDALILFAITIIAALALGAVYEITKDPIAVAKGRKKAEAYQAVYPEMESSIAWDGDLEAVQAMLNADANYEGAAIEEILKAVDNSGTQLGYVMTVTSSKGYGGTIKMAMGVSLDGTLKGISFSEINETPGFGMGATEPEFQAQFKDAKVGQYSLAKKGIPGDTEIVAISGATKTTTAVTIMINAGLKFVSEMGGAK